MEYYFMVLSRSKESLDALLHSLNVSFFSVGSRYYLGIVGNDGIKHI